MTETKYILSQHWDIISGYSFDRDVQTSVHRRTVQEISGKMHAKLISEK
jgi:hypothetical protein